MRITRRHVTNALRDIRAPMATKFPVNRGHILPTIQLNVFQLALDITYPIQLRLIKKYVLMGSILWQELQNASIVFQVSTVLED